MTPTQQACLGRAIEDETVARLLFSQNQYRWCITTAFYSAIWYVDSAVFPLTVTEKGKSTVYSDFGDFVSRYGGIPHDTPKHRKRIIAIGRIQGQTELKGLFDSLLGISFKTRYSDNVFKESDAVRALQKLDAIKVKCAAITPPVLPQPKQDAEKAVSSAQS